MGEILRAVMDASCTFSAPAFYTLTILPKAVAPPDGGPQDYQLGSLQLKQDRWFLCVGMSLDTGYITDNQIMVPTINSAFTVTVQPSGYQTSFDAEFPPVANNLGRGGQQACVMNVNLNGWTTFPEYILFPPNAVVGVTGRMWSRNLVPETYINYLNLVGIEYGV